MLNFIFWSIWCCFSHISCMLLTPGMDDKWNWHLRPLDKLLSFQWRIPLWPSINWRSDISLFAYLFTIKWPKLDILFINSTVKLIFFTNFVQHGLKPVETIHTDINGGRELCKMTCWNPTFTMLMMVWVCHGSSGTLVPSRAENVAVLRCGSASW